jgi:FtsP/CotA-like multicopper oxidase with cupredoxin domain
VQNGHRYRFRVISSINHPCPAILEIENHNLTVIATDSFDVQPATVNSIVISAGERYDFVVNANRNSGSFLMRVKAIGACAMQQFAVFSYEPPSVSDLELAAGFKSFPTFTKSFGKEVVSF